MNEKKVEEKIFTEYEYKEAVVSRDKVSFYLDCYENFGWMQDSRIQDVPVNHGNMHTVLLKLKRDRKIVNKMELTRLQRHFEACAGEIETLEKSPSSIATRWALSIAFIGTVCMAGSTFAVTASPPVIWLCIVLAVPGFSGWILSWPVYKKKAGEQRRKVTALIENKYDEIYEICRKGNSLL